MSAHIEVYLGKKEGWHSWCQTSSFVTEGNHAKNQFALHDAARADGLDLTCGQTNLEEAQKVVDWLKIHRPGVQFKAVDGPCQRRDPYEYENLAPTSLKPVLFDLFTAAREVLLNTGVDQYPAPKVSLDKLRIAIEKAEKALK